MKDVRPIIAVLAIANLVDYIQRLTGCCVGFDAELALVGGALFMVWITVDLIVADVKANKRKDVQ